MSINLNIQNIILTKHQETTDFIWYKFCVDVGIVEEINNKPTDKVSKRENRFGIIKFKKAGTIEETTYEIIEAETDQEILADHNFKHIVWGCLYALMQCKRKGIYPERTAYQCG